MPVLHHILDGRLGEALLAHRLLEHLELRLRHRRCSRGKLEAAREHGDEGSPC